MSVQLTNVGSGNVVLLAGGGKIWTDVAARFCRSEKALNDIIGAPYDKQLVSRILSGGHLAATEFDYFIFGVEGYSRVCETQLVRKRHASYLIKSGRAEKHGRRSFDIVLPESVQNVIVQVQDGEQVISINTDKLLRWLEAWYAQGVENGVPEEELRYMKPQGTEFKAIIGMNAHALMDWFKIRCCRCAQTEIRDLAWKMLKLCKKAAPDLFVKAGPSCVSLGFCPENAGQHPSCKGEVMTHDQVLHLIQHAKLSQS